MLDDTHFLILLSRSFEFEFFNVVIAVQILHMSFSFLLWNIKILGQNNKITNTSDDVINHRFSLFKELPRELNKTKN